MKDYHGKFKYVMKLGIVTLAEFEKIYNEVANSPDKCPTASNLFPIIDSSGCIRYKSEEPKDPATVPKDRPSGEPLYDALIFYETKPEPEPFGGMEEPEEEKGISLEM